MRGLPPDCDSGTDWADFAQQRLAAQQEQQAIANQIAATRIWTINRKTGDVSYVLNGRVSVIDRGRVVTVLNQDEAAVLFGLEMAIHKYGSRIACSRSEEWKRMVAMCVVSHGIFTQFTDPDMQGALHQQQLLANPLQLRAARLHSIETRLRTEETEDLIFTDEADARRLLSSLQPAAQSRQFLEILKVSQQPEPKANVGGNLTITLVRSSTGQQAFRVSIHEGKRQEIIDRVAQLRQTVYLSSRNNFRMLSNERSGRQLITEDMRHRMRSAWTMRHGPLAGSRPRSSRECGRRLNNVLTTRLCECGLDWHLEFINGCEVGHHHAKRLGLIHAAKNLPADSLQFIRNLVGQRKHKRGVDTLKWNVQPLVVVERAELRLRGFALEFHDYVLSERVLFADFQHGKELAEMCLGEFGIHRKPDLSSLLCGSNDSALRSG